MTRTRKDETMTTTTRRFKVQSEEQAIQKAMELRRKQGRMATVEVDNGQYYLCVPMEVVTVRYDQVIAPYRFN